VLELEPASVLEFGCNYGRNLVAIRERDPGVRVLGIDVNAAAVARGRRHHGLPLRIGDERVLRELRGSKFDVAFTVSVLDHVPDPEPILQDLLRIAAKAVLLLEPWLGVEGKIVRDVDGTGTPRETDPYCYSWDYARMLERYAPAHEVSIEPYDLGGPMWSAHYALFTARPRRAASPRGAGASATSEWSRP